MTRRRRSNGETYAMVPTSVVEHPAVTELSAAVRWVLVVLAGRYRGGNNGALTLTVAHARRCGISSRETLRRALADLERRGLILRTDAGSYRPPRPARYALAWHPIDDTQWTTATREPPRTYDRITAKNSEDRSSVPTGPTTGPNTGPTTGPAGPTIGPNHGTDHRSSLDVSSHDLPPTGTSEGGT